MDLDLNTRSLDYHSLQRWVSRTKNIAKSRHWLQRQHLFSWARNVLTKKRFGKRTEWTKTPTKRKTHSRKERNVYPSLLKSLLIVHPLTSRVLLSSHSFLPSFERRESRTKEGYTMTKSVRKGTTRIAVFSLLQEGHSGSEEEKVSVWSKQSKSSCLRLSRDSNHLSLLEVDYMREAIERKKMRTKDARREKELSSRTHDRIKRSSWLHQLQWIWREERGWWSKEIQTTECLILETSWAKKVILPLMILTSSTFMASLHESTLLFKKKHKMTCRSVTWEKRK